MKYLFTLLLITLILNNTLAVNVDQLTGLQSGSLILSSAIGATNYLSMGGVFQINFNPAFSAGSNPNVAFAIAQFSKAVGLRYQISLIASPPNNVGIGVTITAGSNIWNTFTYNWIASLSPAISSGYFVPPTITTSPMTNKFLFSLYPQIVNTNQLRVKFDVFIVGFDITPVPATSNLVLNVGLSYVIDSLAFGATTTVLDTKITSDVSLSQYNLPIIYTTPGGTDTWTGNTGSKYQDFVYFLNNGVPSSALINSPNINFPVDNAVTFTDIKIKITYQGILNNIQYYYYTHPVQLANSATLKLTTGFNTFSVSSSINSQNLFISSFDKNNLASTYSVKFFGLTGMNILPSSSTDVTISLVGTTTTISSVGSTITALTASYYFYQAGITTTNYCSNTIYQVTAGSYTATDSAGGAVGLSTDNDYPISISSTNAATVVSTAMDLSSGNYFIAIQLLDSQGCAIPTDTFEKTTMVLKMVNGGPVVTTQITSSATPKNYFINPSFACGVKFPTKSDDKAFRYFLQPFTAATATQTEVSLQLSTTTATAYNIYVRNLNIYRLAPNQIIDFRMSEQTMGAAQYFYNFQTKSSALQSSSYGFFYKPSGSITQSNAIVLNIQNNFPISFSLMNNVDLVTGTYTLQFYILDSAGNIPSSFASPTLNILLNGVTQLFSITATLSNPFALGFTSSTVLTEPLDSLYVKYSISITPTVPSNNIQFTLSDSSVSTHVYWIRGISLAVKSIFDPVSRQCVAACPTNSYINSKTRPESCQLCTNQGLVATSTGCQCPTSKYFDSVTSTCKNCLYSCKTCIAGSTTTCVTCLPNRSLSALLTCPCSSGFTEVNLVCVACVKSCLTCQTTVTTCTSCDSTTGRTLNTATSVCACPTGFYDDGINSQCQTCPVNCQSCSLINGAVACTGCFTSTSNFRATTVTNNNCPCLPGYTQNNPKTLQCQRCYYACATCSGTTINNCLTCPTGSNRSLFPSPTVAGGNICQCNYGYADLGIPTCTLTSCTFTYACTSCPNGICTQCDATLFRVLNTTTYLCNCITGHYQNANNVCVQCPLGCLSCTSATSCTSCFNFATLSNGGCGCLTGYYPSAASQNCLACPTGCVTCSSATNCLTCSNGFNLNAGSCLCNSGTYLVNSGCQSCPANSATCNSNGIPITCVNLYYLYNNNCVASCPSNTYTSGSACMNCPSTCATCTGPTTCLTCVTPNLLSGTICVTTCPSKTFKSGSICSNCDASCSSCTDGTPSGCTACSNANTYLLSGQCVSTCPSTTTVINGACINCNPNCLTCLGSATICTSCLASQYLYVNTQTCVTSCPANTYQVISSCYNSCPSGYFVSGSSCQKCSQVCDQCSVSAVNCTACPVPYYLYNGNCLNACPSGTIPSGSTGSQTCQSCDPSCNGCSSSNPTSCTNCASGYQRATSGTCIPVCTGSTYFNGLSCLPCPSNCLACTSSAVCNQCVAPTVSQGGVCVTCISPCNTCVSGSPNSCLTCVSPFGLSGTTCVSTCPNGQSIQNGVCTCASGLILNGACVTSCPTGTTQLGNQCQTCTSNCATCTQSVSSCTSCLTGYNLVGTSCVFNNNCPYGQAPNNAGICTSYCPQGTYYQNGFCVQSCSNGQVPNSVGSGCVTPSTPTCPSGQYIYQNQCVANCPSGTYVSSSSCVSCSSNCAQCTSATSCQICTNGFVLSNGACVASNGCPAGQFILANTCVSTCPIGTYDLGNYCQIVCASGTFFVPSVGFCEFSCPPGTIQQTYACV